MKSWEKGRTKIQRKIYVSKGKRKDMARKKER
jgi:hypothetical protein